jgi:hypothetical protein
MNNEKDRLYYSMNYQEIYDNLIQSAQLRPDIAFLNGYTERHHILPRSMGGTDEPDNLVKLTAREHFIAHWLLWRIHRTREMAYAFNGMCSNSSGKRYHSSRGYAIARKAASRRGIKTGPHDPESNIKRSNTMKVTKRSQAWEYANEIKSDKAAGMFTLALRRKYKCSYYTIRDILSSE